MSDPQYTDSESGHQYPESDFPPPLDSFDTPPNSYPVAIPQIVTSPDTTVYTLPEYAEPTVNNPIPMDTMPLTTTYAILEPGVPHVETSVIHNIVTETHHIVTTTGMTIETSGGSSGGSRPGSPRSRHAHGPIKGAWAPVYTQHELHSREVYARSKTPSPPCKKYAVDKETEEVRSNVVKRREQEAEVSEKLAVQRHQHEGIVMQRAREFERRSRLTCNRYAKQVQEFESRMTEHEVATRPAHRHRAHQERALGLPLHSSLTPGHGSHHHSKSPRRHHSPER